MIAYDVVVIGGGAAGMFCAAVAGRRGRRTLLIEHNDKVGKKIGISGGGRCNFTNIHAGPENYLATHPDFCRSAFSRYSPWDFIALVEKHGIAYHEKKLGQQFCDDSSRQIIELLQNECAEAGVVVQTNCSVREVCMTDRFAIDTSQGSVSSESLVIATGGLSFAKLGATDFGYRIARQFGLKIVEPRPGLVPLTFAAEDRDFFQALSGLSLPVEAHCGNTSFREAMLFTHRGVSGPVILQISSYQRGDESVLIDLLPGDDLDWLRDERNSRLTPSTLLARRLPERFAHAWSQRHFPDKPMQHFKNREFDELQRLLHRWPLPVAGTEGYPKAEVTLGGVDTGELSSKTMEARAVKGLFFIGEVVDVTGWLGGYNFQWAWASANAAGSVA